MKKISSQEDLEELLSLEIWQDAFIREMYMLSPSYSTNGNIIAYGAVPILLIFIQSPNSSMELIFHEVEACSFFFRSDLIPGGRFYASYISFSFSEESEEDINAKYLFYKILDENSHGKILKYGIKDYFDESGFRINEAYI